jgi:hypothetical protein
MDLVNDYVYNNFERARDLLYPVHDIDLKRRAIRKARMISLHGFVASDHWISNFKFKHNICSRKIIKVRVCFVATLQMQKFLYYMNIISLFQVITKRELVDEFEIKKSAEQCVMQVKSLLPRYDEDFVLNTDQSGPRLDFLRPELYRIEERKQHSP